LTIDTETTHLEHTEAGNRPSIKSGKHHVLDGVATRGGALGRDFADAPAGCGVMTMDEFLELNKELSERNNC